MKAMIAVLLFTIPAVAQMKEPDLLKLDREFAQATASEHLDGWMRYMMDYTVIFGPQGYSQIVSGKEEIRAYYRDLFSTQEFKVEWTPVSAHLLPSGATGYTTGTFHWVMPNKSCKCVSDWHGTYLAVWEKEQSTGVQWKIKALFPSADPNSLSCGCGS